MPEEDDLRPVPKAKAKGLSRNETEPSFTHYKFSFQGTLDHLIYNSQAMEVTSLLEIPTQESIKRDRAIPSVLYPSDHLRIEAVFTLK